MSEQQQPINKPVLQKPPGYRDPSNPGNPISRPPVRNVVLPPSFRPRKRRSNCCRICCCIFFIIFLILLFIFLILAGSFYLWFEPQMPSFHLLSFKISNFTVTNRDDGTYLNAATVARIEVRNPNSKLMYSYGASKIEMTVGEDRATEFGSTTLPAFTQGTKNTTTLRIETRVKNELVEDNLGLRLKSQFKRKKLVVSLRVKTSVGLRVSRIEIGKLSVNVRCDDISLKKINGGGDMPKCTINALKWIKIR